MSDVIDNLWGVIDVSDSVPREVIESAIDEIERLTKAVNDIMSGPAACGEDCDLYGLGLYEFCQAVLMPDDYPDFAARIKASDKRAETEAAIAEEEEREEEIDGGQFGHGA